jgi:hypothetical protein
MERKIMLQQNGIDTTDIGYSTAVEALQVAMDITDQVTQAGMVAELGLAIDCSTLVYNLLNTPSYEDRRGLIEKELQGMFSFGE